MPLADFFPFVRAARLRSPGAGARPARQVTRFDDGLVAAAPCQYRGDGETDRRAGGNGSRFALFSGVLASVLVFGQLVGLVHAQSSDRISYNEHIRPLLSDRCFYCHGPDEKHREANLRLDIAAGATADLGGYQAIVPGRPADSVLLERVRHADADLRMPPADSKKPALTSEEIALLERWIAEGATYEGHWAFLPLRDELPPAVPEDVVVHNPIDQFIAARLLEFGLRPSPEADRATLLRRVTLDLTGLLPTPEEVAAFAADPDPASYERQVDRLLASPHYGERWGRHWLDQARYADSHGYTVDGERPMWPYRDWVIRALNEDMPFDEFTRQQLAGDLFDQPTKEQLVATAFHRNTLINQEGGTDAEQFRTEATIDRVNTTGAVWLGLTLGCAQCHSHKFDPIAQREYYQLLAFFNSTADVNNAGPTVSVAPGELFGVIPPPAAPQPGAEQPAAAAPGAVELMIMRDLEKPRETYLLIRGDFTRPDKAAGPLHPDVPSAIGPRLEMGDAPPNRRDLADWLVDERNPLPARVTMNRTWMRFFGRGLVETDEDFGAQGAPPTHPALLDWLAREFIRQRWSTKSMHRLIVTSATYRQASVPRVDLNEHDPRNLLLGRQERFRLEAEIVRDAALCASGLLTRTIGGPSVHPPQPEGVYAFTQTTKQWPTAQGADRYRRAMYTFFYRSAPYPLFTTFDAPDFQTTCTRRLRSNTPLQSLTLSNDPAFLEMARALAARILREVPGEPREQLGARIERVMLYCVSRSPTPTEGDLLRRYYDDQGLDFQNDPAAARQFAGEPYVSDPAATDEQIAEVAAWIAVTRALLNTDNFITRE